MNILQRFEFWGDSHHPKWLDIIRILLGIYLAYRGIDYLQHMSALIDLMTYQSPFGSFMIMLLGHYVCFAHIVGGILMALGLFTRLACLIQIPILLGAIIFINSSGHMFAPYSEMPLSIIVLLLLVYFLVVGNGPWALNIGDGERHK
jgi:putative oxidoreductase